MIRNLIDNIYSILNEISIPPQVSFIPTLHLINKIFVVQAWRKKLNRKSDRKGYTGNTMKEKHSEGKAEDI